MSPFFFNFSSLTHTDISYIVYKVHCQKLHCQKKTYLAHECRLTWEGQVVGVHIAAHVIVHIGFVLCVKAMSKERH